MPEGMDGGTRLDRAEQQARRGDLQAQGALEPDYRFAVIVAALTALHLDAGRLRHEIAGLLAEGADPLLLEDILVQMAAYVGFPRAGRALAALGDAGGSSAPTAEAAPPTDDERYARGTAAYAKLNAGALATIEAAFGAIAGDLIPLTFRSFGDVYATSRQPLPVRQIATVAALAALGGVAPQLRFHIGAALDVGVTPPQLVEAIAWVQVLAGMPAAYNALVELKRAMTEGTGAPPAYR